MLNCSANALLRPACNIIQYNCFLPSQNNSVFIYWEVTYMEENNKLWGEFCRSGSIMSYLSYKQKRPAIKEPLEFEMKIQE